MSGSQNWFEQRIVGLAFRTDGQLRQISLIRSLKEITDLEPSGFLGSMKSRSLLSKKPLRVLHMRYQRFGDEKTALQVPEWTPGTRHLSLLMFDVP